jgi:Tol biopolymer transport system component
MILGERGHCEDKAPRPVMVIAEHEGNNWEVVGDEIVLKLSDGKKDYLTNNRCMESNPVLSHNDSIVAFLRSVDSNEDGEVKLDDVKELWIMRLRNRAETRIAHTLNNPSQPSWHPSRLELAFIATDPHEGRGLYKYDFPSRKLSRLTSGAETWPTWSFSGDYIAYYDDKNRVALFSFAGKDVKILTKDVGDGLALAWTTDEKLVFALESPSQMDTWKIYDPKTGVTSPLDDAGRRSQIFVDQQKFGWAATAAKEGAEGQPATRSELKLDDSQKPRPEAEGRSR